MRPFDLEVWFGERVAVLGCNGSGKSHFLRLLAAGGTDPDAEHRPVGDVVPAPVAHTGSAQARARGCGPGGSPRPTSTPRSLGRTLLEILHRGDEHRAGRGARRRRASLDRYGLARASEQTFDSLSGGQQARFQILLLELSGATCCCSTSRPTTSTCTPPRRWRRGSTAFEGTVVAVTHDRWFARGFDRFLVFGADGRVYESDRTGLGRGPGGAGPLSRGQVRGRSRCQSRGKDLRPGSSM